MCTRARQSWDRRFKKKAFQLVWRLTSTQRDCRSPDVSRLKPWQCGAEEGLGRLSALYSASICGLSEKAHCHGRELSKALATVCPHISLRLFVTGVRASELLAGKRDLIDTQKSTVRRIVSSYGST